VTTVAITGASGLIGRGLVAALEAREDVTRIVGLDVAVPEGVRSPRYVHRIVDVRDPGIRDALEGVDVLVHLAFLIDSHRDGDLMRAINVEGTRTVIEAAHAAGVGRVVHLSSVVAYGAHPDNDLPLTETSALRGTPGYDYSEHKREVEEWLWSWHADHPELRLTVLRPAAVLGPGVESVVTRLLELPRMPAVAGHRPPLQFVHVDDVVTAIEHVMVEDLDGVYNVCAEGWLPYDEVVTAVGRGLVEVPLGVATGAADLGWRLGLTGYPVGVVQMLMHPWVMSSARLTATGWHPRHTNRDALAETLAEHGDRVLIGRWRTSRTAVAIGGRVLGAAAIAGAVAAVRRRRRRRRA